MSRFQDDNLAGQAQTLARDVLAHKTTKKIDLHTPSVDNRVREREQQAILCVQTTAIGASSVRKLCPHVLCSITKQDAGARASGKLPWS